MKVWVKTWLMFSPTFNNTFPLSLFISTKYLLEVTSWHVKEHVELRMPKLNWKTSLATMKSMPTKNCHSDDMPKESVIRRKNILCVLLERCWTSTYIHPQDERCNVRNYSTDHILNYASCALGLGLLARNFHDATCEGDGGRTIRCWKCLLLHYSFDNGIKYAPEAFVLLRN